MVYEPFERGAHPVGVASATLRDGARERALDVEIWYPADEAHRGEDLAPETQDRYRVFALAPPTLQSAVRGARPDAGAFPLVLFSHGFGGHRRQTSHFCIHLASHGYVVASVDHAGNTVADMLALFQRIQSGFDAADLADELEAYAAHRPGDARFVLDRVLAGDVGAAFATVDPGRVGMAGHSFGGWTTLALADADPRIGAALPLAPANQGTALLPESGAVSLPTFVAGREVPTLYLAADRDTLLPLDGMRALLERTPGRAALAVLANADHMHFCDEVEPAHELSRSFGSVAFGGAQGIRNFGELLASIPPAAELCPGAHAYDFVRGLGLAHMDAHLKASAAARDFLAGGAVAALAARGVACEWVA